jgi:hypothetical protein
MRTTQQIIQLMFHMNQVNGLDRNRINQCIFVQKPPFEDHMLVDLNFVVESDFLFGLDFEETFVEGIGVLVGFGGLENGGL